MFENMQVDLVGGYYDAGDNVKFGLPMAFTITMMSWSIIEYGKQIAAGGELGHAMDAVKWGTDYLIKAHPEPDVLYGEVPFAFQLQKLCPLLSSSPPQLYQTFFILFPTVNLTPSVNGKITNNLSL